MILAAAKQVQNKPGERERPGMYYKKPQGWAKHTDFILWDMVCLQCAFVLAYMTRHGFLNP